MFVDKFVIVYIIYAMLHACCLTACLGIKKWWVWYVVGGGGVLIKVHHPLLKFSLLFFFT